MAAFASACHPARTIVPRIVSIPKTQAFTVMPRPSKYSPAEKAFLLKTARLMLREGISRKEICARLQLHNAMLTAWLREEALNAIYPTAPQLSLRNRAG